MMPKKDQPRIKLQVINIRPAVVDDVAEIVALVNTHAFALAPISLQYRRGLDRSRSGW
jgi:hypothetical protein